MSGKKILALVLAVVVGIVLVRILFWLIGAVFSFIIPLAIGAVVVYALYRGFNYMLENGKRLT